MRTPGHRGSSTKTLPILLVHAYKDNERTRNASRLCPQWIRDGAHKVGIPYLYGNIEHPVCIRAEESTIWCACERALGQASLRATSRRSPVLSRKPINFHGIQTYFRFLYPMLESYTTSLYATGFGNQRTGGGLATSVRHRNRC
jgi:hypothetical protein